MLYIVRIYFMSLSMIGNCPRMYGRHSQVEIVMYKDMDMDSLFKFPLNL